MYGNVCVCVGAYCLWPVLETVNVQSSCSCLVLVVVVLVSCSCAGLTFVTWRWRCEQRAFPYSLRPHFLACLWDVSCIVLECVVMVRVRVRVGLVWVRVRVWVRTSVCLCLLRKRGKNKMGRSKEEKDGVKENKRVTKTRICKETKGTQRESRTWKEAKTRRQVSRQEKTFQSKTRQE